MGFKPKQKTYTLAFDGTEYEGMEIVTRGLTTGEYLEISNLQQASDEESMRAIADYFVQHIVSWNVEEDDDTPSTITTAKLLSFDLPMVEAMVAAWMEAAGGVSAPLDESLNSGGTSEALSLPMEPLSESLAS